MCSEVEMQFLPLFLILFLWSQTVLADQVGITQQSITEILKPFHASNVQDISACKHVTRGLRVETSAPKPPLFVNVENIYLKAAVDQGWSELKGIDFFHPVNLELLAACTLQMRLGHSKPVYIPGRSTFIGEWPEVKKSGNLAIWVKIAMMDSIFDLSYPSKTLALQVIYYRSDVNDAKNLKEQCVIPFPYSDDTDFLQKTLTRAIRTCLYKPYATIARE